MRSIHIALAGFVALQVGCILVVNESTPNGDQFGTTCQLLDTTSPCGACIEQQCSAQVTACCTDATCKDALKQFDTCADDAGTCSVDVSTSAANTLGTCINSKCTMCDVVAQGDGGTTTVDVACSTNAPLGYCFCDGNSPGSKLSRCDPTTVPNSICCADNNYPTSGTCTCSTIKCEQEIGVGCSCSPSANGNEKTCAEPADGTCCRNDNNGFCTCNNDGTPCDQFTTEVGNCDTPASVQCSSSQVWVTSCSPGVN